jgi:phosphoglycolate phosphatase
MPEICAIFDLDGTLIDSRRDLANAVNMMRQEYKLAALPLEKISSYIGNGVYKLCERSLSGTELDIDDAVALFKKHYRNHLTDYTSCYPGVELGLEALHKAGIPCAVVTNKPQAEAIMILENVGIAGFFSFVVGGGGDFPLKPDPAALLHFARINACEPEKCCMVGDHYTDLEAGANAGMKKIFAKWGFGQPRHQTFDIAAESFALTAKIILNL